MLRKMVAGNPLSDARRKTTEPFRVLLGADLQTNVPQAYTDLCHPKVVAWHLEKKLLKEGAWVAGSLLAASQLKQCDDVAGTLGLDLRVDVRMHAFHQIKSWHTAEKTLLPHAAFQWGVLISSNSTSKWCPTLFGCQVLHKLLVLHRGL